MGKASSSDLAYDNQLEQKDGKSQPIVPFFITL